jgi:hypothetical protein
MPDPGKILDRGGTDARVPQAQWLIESPTTVRRAHSQTDIYPGTSDE